MTKNIIETLIQLSLVGTAVSILALILKKLFDNYFNLKARTSLWFLVLLFFIIPIQIPTLPDKTYVPPTEQLTQVYQHQVYPTITESLEREVFQISSSNVVQDNVTSTSIEVEPKKTSYQMSDFIFVGWMFGILIFMIIKLIPYFKLKLKLKRSSSVCDNEIIELFHNIKKELKINSNLQIYYADNIPSAILIGIVRPTIYLPNKLRSLSQWNYILRHECMHYKNHDLWIKWFAMIVSWIHFFNPVVYFILKEINKDCEVACDYSVIQNLSKEDHIDYGNTILSMLQVEKSSVQSLTTSMTGSKKEVKNRILKIAKIQNKKLMILATTILCVSLIFGCFVFSSIIDNPKNSFKPVGCILLHNENTDHIATISVALPNNIKVDNVEDQLKEFFTLNRDTNVTTNYFGNSIPVVSQYIDNNIHPELMHYCGYDESANIYSINYSIEISSLDWDIFTNNENYTQTLIDKYNNEHIINYNLINNTLDKNIGFSDFSDLQFGLAPYLNENYVSTGIFQMVTSTNNKYTNGVNIPGNPHQAFYSDQDILFIELNWLNEANSIEYQTAEILALAYVEKDLITDESGFTFNGETILFKDISDLILRENKKYIYYDLIPLLYPNLSYKEIIQLQTNDKTIDPGDVEKAVNKVKDLINTYLSNGGIVPEASRATGYSDLKDFQFGLFNHLTENFKINGVFKTISATINNYINGVSKLPGDPHEEFYKDQDVLFIDLNWLNESNQIVYEQAEVMALVFANKKSLSESSSINVNSNKILYKDISSLVLFENDTYVCYDLISLLYPNLSYKDIVLKQTYVKNPDLGNVDRVVQSLKDLVIDYLSSHGVNSNGTVLLSEEEFKIQFAKYTKDYTHHKATEYWNIPIFTERKEFLAIQYEYCDDSGPWLEMNAGFESCNAFNEKATDEVFDVNNFKVENTTLNYIPGVPYNLEDIIEVKSEDLMSRINNHEWINIPNYYAINYYLLSEDKLEFLTPESTSESYCYAFTNEITRCFVFATFDEWEETYLYISDSYRTTNNDRKGIQLAFAYMKK